MDPIIIQCAYKYQEEFIPPRCRKPRHREVLDTCPIIISRLLPSETPIAFRHTEGYDPKYSKEYRVFQDKLYTRVRAGQKTSNAKGWWMFEEFKQRIERENSFSFLRDSNGYFIGGKESAVERLKAIYSSFFVLDNEGQLEVWERTGEPMYEIATFGLGNNHASTDYFIVNRYNSNVHKARYFSALQFDACVKEALRVAAERGDTNSFESIQHGPRIEVLMPEMVRRNPSVDAGEGDSFCNLLNALTAGAESVGEAAALVVAAAGSIGLKG